MTTTKKPTITALKKKAWDAFSKYIRARDCLRTTGSTEYGHCCTCGKVYGFKQLQGGHFVPGRHNVILFDERNCHAQCYHCNVGLKGNPRQYDKFMRDRYGDEIVAELDNLDGESKKFDEDELRELASKYRIKYMELL